VSLGLGLAHELLVLGQELGRLGPAPLGFGQLLLQRLLARLDRTEDGGPGEPLEDQQQRHEDEMVQIISPGSTDNGPGVCSSWSARSTACSMRISLSREPAPGHPGAAQFEPRT
jgi:hypothetical protein